LKSKNLNFNLQKSTRIVTGLFCFSFLLGSLAFPAFFKTKLGEWTAEILEVFGGFYLFLGFAAVAVMVLIALSPMGGKKLGKGEPEYSWFSWIAMLYSTGIGAGLLLRAVQEPVFYFTNPPRESSLSAGDFALEYTFFHWGFTPWAFYGLFGLVIASNLFHKEKTILSSSILPSRFSNSFGAVAMDSLTIICTLLGVVAAVGLGSRQLLDAIAYWLGWEAISSEQAIFPVLAICALATVSAYSGVNKGIRILSNLNIGLAIGLMLFTWYIGSSGIVTGALIRSIGGYLVDFIPMSLNMSGQKVSVQFLTDWTIFYWAFWLAWAPFTGVFIARISKGRTVRSFVIGTMLIPSVGTFLWFSIFGANAFALIEAGLVSAEKFESIYSAIFNFFAAFPLSTMSNAATTVLIITFLVTSVDSAIFVLSMFSDGGKTDPSRKIRLFWGFSIPLFTVAVILIGKDQLLGSVSQLLILFALPFSFLFAGMVGYFIFRTIKEKNN
jgi:glycine betaine transporter